MNHLFLFILLNDQFQLCRNGGCGGGESVSETPYGEEEDEIAASLYSDRTAEERIHLINALSGDNPDGQSLAAGMSVNSGISGETTSVQPSSSGQPLTYGCKVSIQKRRQSVESGINSLGEKGNFDGASVNAMAGSRYDNKVSVSALYIFWSSIIALFSECIYCLFGWTGSCL